MIENGGKGEWKRAREKGRGAMKEGERGMNGECARGIKKKVNYREGKRVMKEGETINENRV